MNIDVKQNNSGHWFYSFAIEKGTAPRTLLAGVTEESATVPDNSISKNSQNVNTNSEKNSAKRFALPEGLDSEVDFEYTEKQYNDFGWARGNNILNAGQSADYRSKFAQAVTGRQKFEKTKYGEWMIPVSDIYDPSLEGINNTIVYAKGKIDAPIFTRVLEIDLDNETELAETRRHIYEIERRGTQQKTSDIFRRHNPSDIGYIQWTERSRAQSQRHNDRLGADGRAGTGKAEKASKRIKNPYLPVVHTFTDISGRKRNVIRVDGEFMIEGNDHARYSATIEDAVSSENKRIIDRYARKYNTTAGIVRKKLTADPDFLKSEWKKGKRFALPDTKDSVMIEVDPEYKPTWGDRAFSGWTASQIAFTNAQAGIETIGKKYGVKNIESLVPVKLEVKKFKDKQNTLYIAVALEKIKMTEVLGRGNTLNGVTQQPRSVNISISKIFEKSTPPTKLF